jgi:hypothetical protein
LEELMFSTVLEQRKDLEGGLAERVTLRHTRDSLHGLVPLRVAVLAIKREDAVYAARD